MKIDLFSPPFSKFGSLQAFTEFMLRALEKEGFSCRLFDKSWTKNPQSLVEAISKEPPDCTLSFNGLLPDREGRFFCDYLNIPHLCYLVDSPNHFFQLTGSPLALVASIDGFFTEFFERLGKKRTLFLPHAAPSDLLIDLNAERPYDLSFIGSFIPPSLPEGKYTRELEELLYRAAEASLQSEELSYIEAFIEEANASNAVDPSKLNYPELFDDLEDCIRGRARLDLLRSLKGRQLHLFGDPAWKRELSDCPWITFHGPVPYRETFSIYKKSKIVLNSSPNFKRGGHERIFTAMACGAAVATEKNVFLQSAFLEDREILFYSYGEPAPLLEAVDFYLGRPEERLKLALEGRSKTLREHTWEERARQLAGALPSLLKEALSS